MPIQIKVRTNSRQESVTELSPGKFVVSVNAHPRDGEANDAIIGLLARHFGVPKSFVALKSGHKSKLKQIEIKQI